jgi:ligand-binding sensor domain-containing protein
MYYGPTELRGRRSEGVTSILVAQDHSLWVGIEAARRKLGLQQLINGSWKQFVVRQLDGGKLDVSALLLDRQNTLWIGTVDQGVLRVRGSKVDHFGRSDGLSSDLVMGSGLFEDHEGNVWVITSQGLDCFRDLTVTTFSEREGLTRDEVDAVLASRDGTVWVGEPGALDALQPGSAFAVRWHRDLPGEQVTALLEDHSGRLWVGIDNSLNVLENEKFRPVKGLAGKSVGFVVGMTEDINHDVWAETSGSPRTLYRIRDFQVQEAFPAPRMPTARRLAADPHGGIWLGLASGDLARYANGKLDIFPFKRSLVPTRDTAVDQLIVNPDGSVSPRKTDRSVILRRLSCRAIGESRL